MLQFRCPVITVFSSCRFGEALPDVTKKNQTFIVPLFKYVQAVTPIQKVNDAQS